MESARRVRDRYRFGRRDWSRLEEERRPFKVSQTQRITEKSYQDMAKSTMGIRIHQDTCAVQALTT